MRRILIIQGQPDSVAARLRRALAEAYARTQSLLMAMLMFASFAGWLLVLYPGSSFVHLLLWQAVFAAMLWLAVAVVFTRDLAQPRGSEAR